MDGPYSRLPAYQARPHPALSLRRGFLVGLRRVWGARLLRGPVKPSQTTELEI